MSGHGHVTPNPDGSKARCGGPALCHECAREQAGAGKPVRTASEAGTIAAVLLPDGQWHDIEPGSYRSWSRSTAGGGTDGRFTFGEGGEVISGPLSSVLATRERPS